MISESVITLAMISKFLSGLLMLLLFSSCNKENITNEANVELNWSVSLDGNKLSNNTVYEHPQGFPFKMSDFKIYFSNFTLKDDKGNIIPLQMKDTPGAEQGVFLFWLDKNMSFSGYVPAGRYTQLNFDIGLRPALNDQNPNQFSKEHPLSRNTDMFWDMTKYRFIVLEGAADNLENGSFSLVYTYHIGGDDFLRNRSIDIDLNVTESGQTSVPLAIDFRRLFSDGVTPIDMTTFFSYHSQSLGFEEGMRMMTYLNEGIYAEMP